MAELFEDKLTTLRVLAVDDEQVIRTMIEYSLQAIGIRDITMASNGNEAMLKLESAAKPIDLIVCDWRMPSMDGLEFLKSIRSRGMDMKFLMLTAENTQESVLEAMKAGANSYIVKPFTVDELRKKIRAITKSGSAD